MAHPETQYLDLIQRILDEGHDQSDRTGVGTRAVFGAQMRFPMSKGFPLLTTKKLHIKSIIHELIWFLNGDTNIKYLKDNKVRIWDEWADENGDLGPVYGYQWRHWAKYNVHVEENGQILYTKDSGGIDQIAELVNTLKKNPASRRMIVSAWNPQDVPKMALPPCHTMWQCAVHGNKLHLQLYQRSADLFLGVPFNIASYALLLHMLADQAGLEAGDFIWTGGDVHIYKNHFDQVRLQMSRTPYDFPTLKILRKPDSIDGYRFEDFAFENYQAHPHIAGEVAV